MVKNAKKMVNADSADSMFKIAQITELFANADLNFLILYSSMSLYLISKLPEFTFVELEWMEMKIGYWAMGSGLKYQKN